ncbi:MAG: alpha/beta fold hydrolase [Myxococcaceae bacterium]|nr:alpha/beta fold hydrolase [Myxococcaceae bacterium]
MGSASPLLPAIATFIALAALLWLWIQAVRRVYRLNRPRAERIAVTAKDGWSLTAFRRAPATRRFEEPVLLCHGLAANHRNMDLEPPLSLAMYLAEQGFDCYSVDWRGTGRSRGAPKGRRSSDYSVDDHILLDGPAFLNEVLRRTGAQRAFWVGHSLGGLVGYGVAQGPEAAHLAGLVTLGSPAFFRYQPYMHRLLRVARTLAWPWALHQRVFSLLTAPFLGHVTLPLTEVVFNPEHIPPTAQRKIYAQVVSSVGRKVLLQFSDWLDHDAFRSFDRSVDYRAGMARIRIPVLVAGGSSDRLAPPDVVTAAYEVLGSPDKTLMIFGRDNGDRLDYGHGDLIFGLGAPTEVFPRIRDWLAARATRVG